MCRALNRAGKQGGSSGSLARPCSGKLRGGSASQRTLSGIAAEVSALAAPPAAAAAESADPQRLAASTGSAPPSLLGFSLSEPADSAAYTAHAAPRDVTQLWATPTPLASNAAAVSDGTAVRLVPVALGAVPEATPEHRPCSTGGVSPPGMPALLADTHTGGDELAATAQSLVRQALAAAGGAPQKQVRFCDSSLPQPAAAAYHMFSSLSS